MTEPFAPSLVSLLDLSQLATAVLLELGIELILLLMFDDREEHLLVFRESLLQLELAIDLLIMQDSLVRESPVPRLSLLSLRLGKLVVQSHLGVEVGCLLQVQLHVVQLRVLLWDQGALSFWLCLPHVGVVVPRAQVV